MTKRLTMLLAALLVLGFVVAGCGGDDEGDNSGNGDTAAETVTDEVVTDEVATDETETESESESSDATTGEDSGGVAAPENRDQASEQCKQAVASSPQLSDDTKSDLEEICEKAAGGDEEAVRDAAREVCEKVVQDTVPEGTPGRDQALDACRQANEQR